MNILVTGGLGFLGHHLCKRILKSEPEANLTIVDDLSSSLIDYSWITSYAKIYIDDFRTVDLSKNRFDQIYHLASPVGSIGILAKNGYIAKQITDLAVKAAEIATRDNASLLYISSSETYGKEGMQKENDDIVFPVQSGARMEYMLGKLVAEHVLHNMSFRYGFRLLIIRPFNIIGEYQSSRIGFVVPTFFENALSGKSIPVFYEGSQTRCFCHVEDMVKGIIEIQKNGISGETYNLGNPFNLISIYDLAITIRNICNSQSTIENVNPEKIYGNSYIEASSKFPSISKVTDQTGWTPVIDLQTALNRIYQFYRNP